jgi:hypothetical protein
MENTQEDADTRIILHALYSDKLYQGNNVQGRIVVKSPDTDVLVLLLHYFPKMKNTSVGSYSLDIGFRLRLTESSMSEHSIRDKSLN